MQKAFVKPKISQNIFLRLFPSPEGYNETISEVINKAEKR